MSALPPNPFTVNNEQPRSVGRPRAAPPPTPPKVIMVCSKCKQEVGVGIPHECKKHNAVANILAQNSPGTIQKVASEVVSQARKAGDTAIKAKRGLFQITPAKEKPQKKSGIDHETLFKLQDSLNLSGRKMVMY